MLTRSMVIEGMVARGDLLYCTLDKVFVRFVRLESDGYVVVCDRNTLVELPDYRHPSQVMTPAARLAMA